MADIGLLPTIQNLFAVNTMSFSPIYNKREDAVVLNNIAMPFAESGYSTISNTIVRQNLDVSSVPASKDSSVGAGTLVKQYWG